MKAAKIQNMKAEIETLERKLFEARAQYASTIGAAFDAIANADNFKASGVILQITALGGKEIIPPVMIRDGLSQASIDAIQDDLKRSFEIATLVNPAMSRESV